MVKSIAIYVEGGGDTSRTLEPFRRGISTFLQPIVTEVRKKRIQWKVIPCGGRKQAYDAFVDAVEKEPEVYNVLLVDSENPVEITVEPWAHLHNRPGDAWAKPTGIESEHCQMMVVCMEAWFIADPSALRTHFGGNFDSRKLPQANLAESRTKDDIAHALRQATRDTKAKEYRKIRDGARLLEILNQAEVRRHCTWCERLFQALGAAIGAYI